MGYPYKIILCPVDFDDNSMAALAHARLLATDMGAMIHLLHVLPILPTYGDQGLAIGVDQTAEHEVQRRLKEIARRRLSRIPTEIHTRIAFVSEVPKTILTYARNLAADLIVMATHGRGVIKHLFFGSVAEAVVRNSVCPVLTLRFAAPAEAEPEAEAAKPAATTKPAATAKPATAPAKKGSRARS